MYRTKIAKDAAEGIKYLKKRRKPLANTQEIEEDLLSPGHLHQTQKRDDATTQQQNISFMSP